MEIKTQEERNMEPNLARAYLKQMKEMFEESDAEKFGDWIAAVDVALTAVNPPMGAGHCEWVYLPDKDMTPFSHIGIVTDIENVIDPMLSDRRKMGIKKDAPSNLILDYEKLNVIDRALGIYKSVLMAVNRDEMRAEMQRIMEERKAGKA